MQWACALSRQNTVDACVREVAAQVREQLGEAPVDVLFVFVSSRFREAYHDLPELLGRHLRFQRLIGCSGGGIIGAGRETERAPALSVAAARLPGVSMQLFHLQDDDLPDLDGPPDAWERATGVAAACAPHFVLLADPFSFHVENLAMGLDYAYPRATKVGGLASDGRHPGENVLYLDRHAFRAGLVGLALWGDVSVESIVAQGCRPVGRPMVVTQAEHNLILALDKRPPLEVLHELLPTLPPRDLTLMRNALFVGIAMDASRQSLGPGDFLIRNVLGVDRDSGIVAVGAHVRVGQVVQFHVRDADSSAEDLNALLDLHLRRHGRDAHGALLFSCLGRGQGLYGVAHHDSAMLHRKLGEIPLAGFFCNGEIGPVGASAFVRTFVHGYTSCFGLFRPASSA